VTATQTFTPKYGRNPGHIPNGLRDLTWYAAGSLPQPPAEVAVPTVPVSVDGTAWGMDGNDTYGDCGVAGINHGFMAAASAVSDFTDETWPSNNQIVSYYLDYTGGEDNGVVLASFLAYVKTNQFFGHSIQAYAPVGVHDIPTLQYVVDAYTSAYTGIKVTAAMQEASRKGNPWSLEDLSSPVAGGHCVPICGYDDRFLYCITWGQVQAISYAAWHFISDEAWAVIPGEFKATDGRGVDLTALQADLSKIVD
jgi:hypothetical protein